MTEHDSPAKLAAHAGLAPVSRDSGTVSGNHRQPRRFHRRLAHPVDGRLHRRPRMPYLPRLLREEARRRKEPPPSHTRPRPTTRRRPLGTHPRPRKLHPISNAGPRRSVNQPVIPPTRPWSRWLIHPAHQDQPELH
ncbi:transposase [Micromonospora echinofusca]|uniref:transposase n=1 Tax=Micromonospora echinofusca TaxID=47858 RepID=UPI0037BCB046